MTTNNLDITFNNYMCIHIIQRIMHLDTPLGTIRPQHAYPTENVTHVACIILHVTN